MFYLIITFGLIALIDFVPLARKKSAPDIAAFLVVFLPAFALAILLTLSIKVPSSMIIIGDALKSIGLSY